MAEGLIRAPCHQIYNLRNGLYRKLTFSRCCSRLSKVGKMINPILWNGLGLIANQLSQIQHRLQFRPPKSRYMLTKLTQILTTYRLLSHGTKTKKNAYIDPQTKLLKTKTMINIAEFEHHRTQCVLTKENENT